MPKIVDHQQQRQALAASAAAVICAQGLELTTLRTVAAAHGCTKGMVQHYFADKAELLSASLLEMESACDRRCLSAAGTRDGLAALERELMSLLPVDANRREEWQVRLAFCSMAPRSSEIGDLLEQFEAAREGRALGYFKSARRNGELLPGRGSRADWRSLNALLTGLACGAITAPSEYTPRTLRGQMRNALAALRP